MIQKKGRVKGLRRSPAILHTGHKKKKQTVVKGLRRSPAILPTGQKTKQGSDPKERQCEGAAA